MHHSLLSHAGNASNNEKNDFSGRLSVRKTIRNNRAFKNPPDSRKSNRIVHRFCFVEFPVRNSRPRIWLRLLDIPDFGVTSEETDPIGSDAIAHLISTSRVYRHGELRRSGPLSQPKTDNPRGDRQNIKRASEFEQTGSTFNPGTLSWFRSRSVDRQSFNRGIYRLLDIQIASDVTALPPHVMTKHSGRAGAYHMPQLGSPSTGRSFDIPVDGTRAVSVRFGRSPKVV